MENSGPSDPPANESGLTARRRAGERFFLALVDPLLKKPAFYELRSPETRVGFLPDCDYTLPWGAMGIGLISDSRRFDEDYRWNCCSTVAFDGRMCAPQIGCRAREPFFDVVYDPSGVWKVVCYEGHGCRVAKTSCIRRVLHHRVDQEDVRSRLNPPSSLDLSKDGSTFEFVWPWASPDLEKDGKYSLPVQKLRFVFCQEGGQQSSYLPRHRHGPPSTLLSLPVEVLARIGSFLKPDQYFSTLALVGRVFTSSELKKQIPWTSVVLDSSFDSFRTQAMASTETLSSVQCLDIWNRESKAAFYAIWRPAIYGEHLTTLDLEDPRLLVEVGVPPQLKELRLRLKVFRTHFWSMMKLLTFPASLTRLGVHYGLLPNDDDVISDEEGGDPYVASHLSPQWLFQALPSLIDVEFEEVLFVKSEWKDVPSECLKRIERLSLRPIMAKFPMEEFSNLKVLDLSCRDGKESHRRDGLNDLVRGVRRFGGFLNLRYLQIKTPRRYPVCLSRLDEAFPNVEFLYVNNATVTLGGMCRLMRKLPSLKEVDVVSSPMDREHAKDVPRKLFPRFPTMMLHWTWFPADEDEREAFSFIFSRATKEEREIADKLLSRVGLVVGS